MAKETYELYGGKVQLDYDSKFHIYSVAGKQVYGVTNIIGVLAKPALIFWASNMAAEYAQSNLQPGKALDEIQIKNLVEGIRTAHRIKKEMAADIGTIGHQWIANYIKARLEKKPLPKKPINEELKAGIEGFFKWAKENKIVLAKSEQKIYSKKYKFAGTYDLEALIGGKKTIIDFKFSNAIYDEYVLQASAYLKAREEELQKEYSGGVKILRLSKQKNDIAPFEVRNINREEVDRYFRIFLYCLGIYRFQMENKKIAALNRINGKVN